MSKSTLALSLLFAITLISGCGGQAVVHASSTPLSSAVGNFPPAQPLICKGDPGNQTCTFSDGSTFYYLNQINVTTRDDGHGTFQLISEAGMNKGGLYQMPMSLGKSINIVEMHATMSINSWCDGNGIIANLDGFNGLNTEHIFGGKTYEFSANQESNFVIPQVVFPVPVPLDTLNLANYTDLCAKSTVHWVIDGSF
jgi:hypothetical protein